MADTQSFIEQLQEFEISDIDFNRAGVWPAPAKIFLAVLISAVIIGACYFLFIKEKQMTLLGETNKEQGLKDDFANKAHEAANLQAYRDQMVVMRESFGALLSRLPTDTEVPDLLEDVSDKGEESRLTINEITLQNEVVQPVHIELPIKVNVSGGFHEFGAFVSGIAGMPRIVTLHDFTIEQESDDSGLLLMQMDAKTYRYKEAE